MKSSNFVLSRAASFASFDQEVPKLLGLQTLFACKKLKSILCLEMRPGTRNLCNKITFSIPNQILSNYVEGKCEIHSLDLEISVLRIQGMQKLIKITLLKVGGWDLK